MGPLLKAKRVTTSNLLSQAWDFIKLTRVLFLLGGFLMYALGSAAAARMGAVVNWSHYALGQVLVLSIQLCAHYLNEYYDVEVDRLNANNRTWFSGGSGILSTGNLRPASVLTAARVCGVIAVISGVAACLISPGMIPIVLLSLMGSWFYSAPPISLMSSGWGELTTSLIVALLVPLAGFCMQAGFPSESLWLVALSLILIHVAMLIAFEFPDYEVDRSMAKTTLTVRLGLRGAAWAAIVSIGLAYLNIGLLLDTANFPGKWMVFGAPIALAQIVLFLFAQQAPSRSLHLLLTTGGLSLFAIMSFLAFLGFVFVK